MSKRDENAAVTRAYLRRIIGYDFTEVKSEYKVNDEGKLELMRQTEQTKHVPGDARAAEFWLRNRQPKLWRKDPAEPEGERPEGGVVEISKVEEPEDGW